MIDFWPPVTWEGPGDVNIECPPETLTWLVSGPHLRNTGCGNGSIHITRTLMIAGGQAVLQGGWAEVDRAV